LVLCQNSQNSNRAPALDRTRAWKTLLNPRGSQQSFRAPATLRTPNKPGSPSALRTSSLSLSLLYKECTWEHYRKLNLIFFTLSARRSRGVFIGGLSWYFRRKWGSGGPLVKPVGHLGWLGGQVSWPHRLSHLRSFSYRLNMTRVKSVISLTSNPAFLPCHLLMSYYLRLPIVLDIMTICMDFGPYDAFPSSDVPKMVDQQTRGIH
jgi:hypothetical protein